MFLTSTSSTFCMANLSTANNIGTVGCQAILVPSVAPVAHCRAKCRAPRCPDQEGLLQTVCWQHGIRSLSILLLPLQRLKGHVRRGNLCLGVQEELKRAAVCGRDSAALCSLQWNSPLTGSSAHENSGSGHFWHLLDLAYFILFLVERDEFSMTA